VEEKVWRRADVEFLQRQRVKKGTCTGGQAAWHDAREKIGDRPVWSRRGRTHRRNPSRMAHERKSWREKNTGRGKFRRCQTRVKET
jgi:hypothetical protein